MLHIKGSVLAMMLLLGGNKASKKIVHRTNTAFSPVYISTDKAAYKPGDKIAFTLSKPVPSNVRVRYKVLDSVIKTERLKGTKWIWTAPVEDFTGYMVELFTCDNGHNKIYATIAIDVSSDPARFPRNGFLSDYGRFSQHYMDSVMQSLNRYHMNYVQFQDWEYEHHQPLAGTPANPAAEWKDIGSRINYRNTVQTYISLAHHYNMLTLHYNLIYGALDNGPAEGVSAQWRLYQDDRRKTMERISLPMPPFKSGLCIMDPANAGWQQYLEKNTAGAWQVYDFDGYQIDQMGDLNKPLYDYDGRLVAMDKTFEPFIKAMKSAFPGKRMVMNAVSQYGQRGIANSPVDFLYTEVWPPADGFMDLAATILTNESLSKGAKRTVMPAYMDYDLAEKQGYFNTPGVILADAVIFAFGGAHLELGDHMLGKEYFPNAHLSMHDDLKAAMISYYDFMTAYENLLRDGGTFNNPPLASANNKLKLNNWPPQQGQVAVAGKEIGNKQVLHLINFSNASSLNWRDNKGLQAKPALIASPSFTLISSKAIKKIWFASPDIDGGASAAVAFRQTGNTITFTLPSLQYWDLVVIEYK